MTSIAPLVVAQVTIGVDTHNDVHVAAALDHLGRPLGKSQVPTASSGHKQLLAWARLQGDVGAWGVEGTGSYGDGVGLTRFLVGADQTVVEVNRPDRRAHRHQGKSVLSTPNQRPAQSCPAGQRRPQVTQQSN